MAEKNVNKQTDKHFRIYKSRDIPLSNLYLVENPGVEFKKNLNTSILEKWQQNNTLKETKLSLSKSSAKSWPLLFSLKYVQKNGRFPSVIGLIMFIFLSLLCKWSTTNVSLKICQNLESMNNTISTNYNTPDMHKK